MFQRQQVNYQDNNKKYFGRNLPNNDVEIINREARVYMAMPKALQTQYQPQYRQVDLGVMGVAGVAALSDENFSAENLTSIVQGAAASGLPEFTTNAIAQSINGLSGMMGLAGNVDANSIQALTRGRVFNPFKEQIFQNMSFRTHNFNFKLFSRNAEEAKQVNNILTYFKMGSVPRLTGTDDDTLSDTISKIKNADGTSANLDNPFENAAADLSRNARFMSVPDNFKIKFVRMNPDGQLTGEKENMHFKIHPSVCTGISINYTPDGQYTSFKTLGEKQVQVPAITLALTFTELKLITQEDISKGY
ncbi:baseplate tail tube cap [Synechococcus phage S-CAM8]|uniref:Baseplate tail tube cap n=1 Tax=Synechococcus phage S-CAM8 TaxID=754038 RepID=A0A1D8KMW5_9CAUD|nr:baseplate tail tube cap [Synechococcus phage S-CAM8]